MPWCGKQIAFHWPTVASSQTARHRCVSIAASLTRHSQNRPPPTQSCSNAPPPQAPARWKLCTKTRPPWSSSRRPRPSPHHGAAVEVVATWGTARPWRVFAMSEWIMRDRVSFFDEVRTRHDSAPNCAAWLSAPSSISRCMASSWAFPTVGSRRSCRGQAARPIPGDAAHLPATLYFFNLLYGSQLTFAQTAALMMAAVTVTAALTLAFASITLFFWLTVPDYGFFILLNVGVLTITAWWGLAFLRQGCVTSSAALHKDGGTHPCNLDRHLCFRRHADGFGRSAILRCAGPSVRDHPPHRGHILYQRIPHHPGILGLRG